MMNLALRIKLFFKTELGLQVQAYFLFYIIMWAFHLLVISVISYFHFSLSHNIGTIADWIVDRGWQVIIFTKIFIFYFTLQFIKLRSKKYSVVRGMFRNSVQWPRHEMIVVFIFLLLALISLGDVVYNKSFIFDLIRPLVSGIGTAVFFGTDLIFLLILDAFNPIRSVEERRLKVYLFPFLFYIFTRSTFIYEQTISLKLYAYFYFILYLAYWHRRNWTLPGLFLLGFLIPAFAFLGLDPIWGRSFSLFRPINEISTFSIFVLIAFAIFYLEYRLKKYPEYIYRN